ncbi:MAG TPA: CHAT domain-containing tetratricopeptide repeat protein [Methylomirabilota bacterium]|nr:CHAT domain-containing tetratricopeptide repeat protein [Methylomirabilota bacterium]
MSPRPVARLVLALLAVLAAWSGGHGSAAAQAFKSVGDEGLVGKNRTGEECRLRLLERRVDQYFERYGLFCEGWSQPSGEVRRFGVPRDATPEKVLTEGWYPKAYETRMGDCKPVEPTSISAGGAAGLRECRRLDGGWRVLVVGAVLGRRGYGLETFPTNLPLLELAVEILEGKRRLEQPGAPPVSAAIRRAETMVGASGRLIGVQDVGARASLYRLGQLQNWAAHYAESEASFRRLLELEERLLGKDDPGSANTWSWLGLDVGDQRRFDEADQIFARAEAVLKNALRGDDHIRYLNHRALVERLRPDYPKAIAYAEEAVRQSQQAGSADSTRMAWSLLTLSLAQRPAGKLDEAQASAERALAILNRPGTQPEFRLWWAGEGYAQLGSILREKKDYAGARAAYDKGLERRRLLLGDSVRAMESYLLLGRLGRAEGNLTAALADYRKAAAIQVADRPTRDRVRADWMVGYLDTLIDLGRAQPSEERALAAEAFAAAQIPRGSETARAITNLAARLAAADPAVRAAAREYQEAGRERDRLRQTLAVESFRESDARDAGREEALKRDLRAAEEKVASLEGRLQAELPRYAQLTAAKPVAVGDLATLLRPGEVLVLFLPTTGATYVFAVRDGQTSVHRAAVPLDELTRRVRAIRASLEVADGTLKPFDTADAAALHDRLLAPLGDRLKGATHLIAVPAGPLLSLPLGLLVTRAPAAAEDYAQTGWLGRDVAISVVPAVSSLASLRRGAGRSAAPRPFLGFGDPDFAGAPGATRGLQALGDLCRQGEPVDTALVRELPRLRETARELEQIATALGADRSSVITGGGASERAVRSASLAEYRVVAFATHGLLPGELRCKSEPALALTPPATASAQDDGLLDASEVAQLRLDADWVLLSACNTAGPDGRLGGESLSGLARAFFYAGARSVLASHWAVASRATVALTTGAFAAMARDPSLGRAEALRRSEMALASVKETAHPFFWAPFVLVGDGGAPPRP